MVVRRSSSFGGVLLRARDEFLSTPYLICGGKINYGSGYSNILEPVRCKTCFGERLAVLPIKSWRIRWRPGLLT